MSNATNLQIGSQSVYLFANPNGDIEFRNQPDGTGNLIQLHAKYPTIATQLVTKGYVDAALAGVKPDQVIQVASTSNISSISQNLEAGDMLDGVILIQGSLILLKNQTDTTQNGVYVVQHKGVPQRWATENLNVGNIFLVELGTVNKGSCWTLSGSFTGPSNHPLYGVDNLVFSATSIFPSTQYGGSGGGSGVSLSRTINQTSHGFSVGNILKFSAGSYSLAQANNEANAEVVGMVDSIINANSFSLLSSGYFSGLSGLTSSEVYFLSASVAGGFSISPPTVNGHVVKPLFFAVSSTSGYFTNYRGNIVSANNLTLTAQAASDVPLTIQLASSQTANSLEIRNSDGIAIALINAAGDIEITDSSKGIVLKSPNGSRYRIAVNNAGVLSTSSL